MHADVAAGEPFDSGFTANDMVGKTGTTPFARPVSSRSALSAATFDCP